RRVLVLAAPDRDPGVQRRAQQVRHRRGDDEAVQGLVPIRGPELRVRRLQQAPVDLRPGGQVRPPGRRGLHQPPRAPASRIQPPARGRGLIAKTDAAGGPGLLPEVLAFSSSLEQDRALLREDLVGSMAHLAMLSRQGIVPAEAARAIHDALVALWRDAESGTFVPAGEEDVHMAVEAELTRRLGDVAGFLHTGRSRNDQGALDLRLFIPQRGADLLAGLS